MRYCYNITFLVDGARRDRQVSWIRQRVAFLGAKPRFTGLRANIATVLAVPGMSDYGQGETSVTAQFEFEELVQAMSWGDAHLPALAGGYARSFGNQVPVMPSVIAVEDVE